MEKLTLESPTCQENERQHVSSFHESFEQFDPVILATAERRVFLAAALRLYLRRLSRGIQVTQTDLYRVARYGDDPGVAA